MANAERSSWGAEWAADSNWIEPSWDDSIGGPPPPFELASFRESLASFPCGTGLGWDAMHPRALLRLLDRLMLELMGIIARCEALGHGRQQFGWW